MEATPESAPAVYAIFLVSETDTAAHDIFRTFRASFEERNAGFAHLVIFGQHGISTAVRALQQELGLAEKGLSVLVLFGGDTGDVPEVVRLPSGGGNETKPEGGSDWHTAMERAERVMDGDGSAVLSRVVKRRLADLCASVVRQVDK